MKGCAEEIKNDELSAKSAILIHLNSGNVLFEKKADERLPPASLTKIMTAILVIERIQKGLFNLDDQVNIDDYSASIRGSRIKLNCNDTISVNDLLKGLMIASGNDAAVAIARYTESNVEQFVEKMNSKAENLGLLNTHFTNPHGLHAADHYSSARDIAALSNKILEWEHILQITCLTKTNILINQKLRTIKNTNPLIGVYIGADGLKTGHTPQAGFCLAATAIRNNQRVLAVLMGVPTRKERNNHAKMMLDYAFSLLTPNHIS